jgi:hypothetical protein
MTQQERDAAVTLGFSEATWTDPDLMDDAVYPLHRSWASLTAAQQSAASSLGYQHHDFGPLWKTSGSEDLLRTSGSAHHEVTSIAEDDDGDEGSESDGDSDRNRNSSRGSSMDDRSSDGGDAV